MRMDRPVRVKATDALRQMEMEIRITGLRRFRARVWLGKHILRFGAWIVGAEHISVVVEE